MSPIWQLRLFQTGNFARPSTYTVLSERCAITPSTFPTPRWQHMQFVAALCLNTRIT